MSGYGHKWLRDWQLPRVNSPTVARRPVESLVTRPLGLCPKSCVSTFPSPTGGIARATPNDVLGIASTRQSVTELDLHAKTQMRPSRVTCVGRRFASKMVTDAAETVAADRMPPAHATWALRSEISRVEQ